MDYDYLSDLNSVGVEIPLTPEAENALPSKPVAPVSASPGDDYLSDLTAAGYDVKAPNPDKVFQAMKNAEGKNPDEEARRIELAKQLGTQPILLPATKEAEAMLQRKQNDPIDLTQDSPATAKWLEQNAHLAGGDIGKLRKMESSYSDLEYLGKAIKAGGRFALAAAAKLAEAALPDTGISEEGAAMLSRGDAAAFERIRRSKLLSTFAREQQAKGEATMRDLSPKQKKEYGSLEYFTTDKDKAAYRNPVKVVSDIFQSLPSSAMMALTFMLTKGAGISARLEALASGATPEAATQAAVAAATKMATVVGGISEGAVTYGQNSLATAAEVERLTLAQIASSPDYQAYLQLGYDPQVARTLLAGKTGELSGVASGISTGAIAGIGGRYLGKIIGEGGSLVPRVGKGAALGSAEEALQSPLEKLAENAAIKLKADESQSLGDGVMESMVQGAVVGGVTSGTMSGFIGSNQQATQAKTDHAALNTMAEQSADNPIRDRAPDALSNFIDKMTEGGPLNEVFVDTNTLHEVFAQSGVDAKELEKILPEVASQMNDETNAEGYVRISTAELMTKIKNPDIQKTILDNARVLNDGKMGVTFLESEAFFQKQHENFTKEAEIAASAKTLRDQHEQDVKEIRKQITDEIAATGRYDRSVAASNAIPITAFYVTQAARFEGMTPKQLFEQYPYRARRGETSGQNTPEVSQPIVEGGPARRQKTKQESAAGKERLRLFNEQREANDKKNFALYGGLPDNSVFDGEVIKGIGNIFGSDSHDGSPVTLSNVGYTLDEQKLLESVGLATDGKMSLQQYTALEEERSRRFTKARRIKSEQSSGFAQAGNNAEFSTDDLMTTFYEGANLSSIIHEAGHFYLEILERLASRPDAPQEVVDDYHKIMDWFGTTPKAWAAMGFKERTPLHEQFAESQELWMLEGKAPTLEMQPVFIRFMKWMESVYTSAEQFLRQNPGAGKLNDEVRAVFSRLIASEEAIKETEAVRGYVPLFQTAEQAGVTDTQFAAYLKEHENTTQGAVENLQKRSMRDMKWLNNARSKVLKGIQAKAKEARDAIREEVTVEVMSEPINQVRQFLRTGETVDALTGQTTTADNFKLNTAAVKDIATDGKVPPHLKSMVAPDGLHPDAVAAMFDFPSGDALLYDLVNAENAQEKIKGITDQRMLERHGEMIDARAIEEAANAAVVNEARTRFLATGLRILTKSDIPVSQLTKAARLAAEEAIAKISVENLRPNQYAAAERKANRSALDNAARDPAAAIRAQRAALLNNQLYKVAVDVQEEINSDLARMKRITKPAAQKAMGGEHLLQLNALLNRFGINSKQSLTAMGKRLDLPKYLATESARLSAIAPNVPDWIASEQVSQDYQTLSLTEFRELMDAVKSIELLARRERNQYMAVRQQTFQEEKASILGRLRQFHPELFFENGKPKVTVAPQRPGAEDEGKYAALLMNAETIVNVLEGGEFGELHESILGRLSARSDWKATRMEDIYAFMKPLFGKYNVLERRAFSRDDIGTKTLGFYLTREHAVSTALLHGSKEGRDRLANYGWNLATQEKIIDLLDPRDVDLVNGIWHLFDDSLWPELKALDERTQGKAAPKVEAIPHTAKGGALKGGYFKIKYVSAISTDPRTGPDAIKEIMEGRSSARASTSQNSSIAREEHTDKPPRLDIGVLFETVNEVVHDLAFREAVADTLRVLTDRDVQMSIKTIASPKEYDALIARVGNVAMREHHPNSDFEKYLTGARKNTVVVLMSGMYTALQNYLGFAPIADRLSEQIGVKGVANVALEIFRMHSPLGPAAYRFAVDNSHYLRNRHFSFDRSLQEEAQRLTFKEPLMPAMSVWLWAVGKTDQIVSAIGWNAAYKTGMEVYGNNHDKSVLYANHVIRQTLGSGRELDISQMQEGPYRQMLTMFYSNASAQLNMQIRTGSMAKREWNAGQRLKAITRIMKATALIVAMPAIMSDVAITLLRGDDVDDDEDWFGRFARDAGLYQLSFVPGLREFGPYFWRRFDPDLAHYGFKITPIESAFTGVGAALSSAVDIYNDEGDVKDTGDIIMGLGYAFGLPGLMVKNAVVGTGAWLNDEAGPEAILFGPPKERK